MQIPIKTIMNRNSHRSYLLVDSGKLGRRSYFSSIPIDQFSHIITSEHAPPEFVQHVRDLGVDVVTVAVPNEEEGTDGGE